MPLIAVEVLETAKIDKLPGFKKRMEWFLNYRKDLAGTDHLLRRVPVHRQSHARDPDARTTGARPALHAGRKRISLAVRPALGLARPPRSSLRLPRRQRRTPRRLRSGRRNELSLRRQLELARADLVPDQLPDRRSAGALSPFLRRFVQGRMPDRFRKHDDAQASRPRTFAPALEHFPA